MSRKLLTGPRHKRDRGSDRIGAGRWDRPNRKASGSLTDFRQRDQCSLSNPKRAGEGPPCRAGSD
jgi:hypothetical protein